MGKLYWRKDAAVWYADYYDRHGIRHRESTRTADRKIAQARLRDLEFSTTDAAPHTSEALNAAIDYFLRVARAGQPAAGTSSYAGKCGHLSRLLGERIVDGLTHADIAQYIADRTDEGAKSLTVYKELTALRQSLKHSKARDRWHGSAEIVPKFKARYEPRSTYLTPDQFKRLLQHIVYDRPDAGPTLAAELREIQIKRSMFVVVAALAGPRLGELMAMRWETDVDFHGQRLRIPMRKTRSRWVPMHPTVRIWLQEHRQATGRLVEPWGKVCRDLKLACERAGVPKVSPNDLRRTFGSWLYQSGASIQLIANLMGNSVRMVELVYGRLSHDNYRDAMAAMPKLGRVSPSKTARRRCDAGVTRKGPNAGNIGGNRQTRLSRPIASNRRKAASRAV